MALKLFKALNSEASPWQLAFGIAFGLVVGLTPLMSLHNIVLVLLVFLLRVNLSAFFLATGFFTGLAYLLDGVSISVGEAILTNPSLQDFWTGLYQSEFWQLTHFNHTLTMGSLVISLILFLPIAVLSKHLIIIYRQRVMASVGKLKIVQMLKGSNLYGLYSSVSDKGGLL